MKTRVHLARSNQPQVPQRRQHEAACVDGLAWVQAMKALGGQILRASDDHLDGLSRRPILAPHAVASAIGDAQVQRVVPLAPAHRIGKRASARDGQAVAAVDAVDRCGLMPGFCRFDFTHKVLLGRWMR